MTEAAERRAVDENGFTLIEVLMVILILAILAATVVFAVQDLGGETARTSCKADYKIVEAAAGAYGAQVGHYPEAGDQAADFPGGSAIPGGLTATMNGVQALFAIQTDPVTGKAVGPWLKDIPANGTHYSIDLSTDGNGTVSVDDAAGNDQPNCSGVQ